MIIKDKQRAFEQVLDLFYDSNQDRVEDQRIASIRQGEDYQYEMPTYTTKQEWQERAEYLRRHILVACGLWPEPEKCVLNENIFGRIEREDYAVEKVCFHSHAGILVTGNLYRPLGKRGPFPGLLCPHGHWKQGRLEDSERGSIPARCINFARRGYVVFSYDMVGYLDNMQVSHSSFGGYIERLWGINLMGLQLWNSIRSLDFLSSLPGVAQEQIGCTGASGGGTQTFMLTAVDPRIKAAVPVNMVSAHFQGGCRCENAPLLRLDTNNVEIAALAAPRPLLLVSCTGDWTKNTPDLEYPAVHDIYSLFDCEDRVESVQIDAEHNYNQDTREAVYEWFAKWLPSSTECNAGSNSKELAYTVERNEDLRVFPNGNLPAETKREDAVYNFLIDINREQVSKYRPRRENSIKEYRRKWGLLYNHTLGVEIPAGDQLQVTAGNQKEVAGIVHKKLSVSRRDTKESIPTVVSFPSDSTNHTPSGGDTKHLLDSSLRSAVFIVHNRGGKGLLNAGEGEYFSLISGILEQETILVTSDLFLTGEIHRPYGLAGRNLTISHFTTFNKTDTAERVQDIVTVISYLTSTKQLDTIRVVGLGEAGLWVLLAGPFIREAVDGLVVDLCQFDLDDDQEYVDKIYIPGLRRAGGLTTAGMLTAPEKMLLSNVMSEPELADLSRLYSLIGAEDDLSVSNEPLHADAVLGWLAGE